MRDLRSSHTNSCSAVVRVLEKFDPTPGVLVFPSLVAEVASELHRRKSEKAAKSRSGATDRSNRTEPSAPQSGDDSSRGARRRAEPSNAGIQLGRHADFG